MHGTELDHRAELDHRTGRDLSAAPGIRRGVIRLSRRLRGARPAHALSATKIGVLAHLHRRGPSSPSEIASADHQRPQALTRVFAELEAAGLVHRAPNEHDGRGAILSLTTDGAGALRRDMAERDRWLAAALEELSDLEVTVLRLAAELMERLADTDPLLDGADKGTANETTADESPAPSA
ncbi:MAG TPA: MarR family transcriptional regulator [Pseudonocardia sp.]|nr:MarR family transcriptional regulator [Pseudonocardia sp.]